MDFDLWALTQNWKEYFGKNELFTNNILQSLQKSSSASRLIPVAQILNTVCHVVHRTRFQWVMWNCCDAAIILKDGRIRCQWLRRWKESSDHDIFVPECLPTSSWLKNNYYLLWAEYWQQKNRLTHCQHLSHFHS